MIPVAQTFRATTPKDAFEAVKAALGKDAVILSTRELAPTRTGLRQFEVTASRDPRIGQATPKAPPRSKHQPRRELSKLADRLMENGVEERAVDRLLGKARVRLDRDSERGEAEVMQEVIEEMVAPSARAPWLPSQDSPCRMVALVGPTGAGKTTTIAKIAARAVLDERLRVALVTLDTFRIGAIDQLGRYAEILGLPMYVARDRRELVRAFEHAQSADLVLIDTAGRSPLDEEATRHQAELLASVPGIELCLTVSAAAARLPMERVAARYQIHRPSGVVVTKIDEAGGLPSIISVASCVPGPIACYSAGQRVPEDIAALDRAQLLAEALA